MMQEMLLAKGDASAIQDISKTYPFDEESILGTTCEQSDEKEIPEKGIFNFKKKRGREKKKGQLRESSMTAASVSFRLDNVDDWVNWDDIWFSEQICAFHFEMYSSIRPREIVMWNKVKDKVWRSFLPFSSVL
jgi:hypothetical protein